MLHRLDDFRNVPPDCRGGIVSIGNFDGVHLGHVQLVECMRRQAAGQGVSAIAFTFDPPPVALLRPEQSPQPLTWTERKVALLEQHGADQVVVFRTSWELLRLTAEQFFREVIERGLRACGLVEGPNFGFGRNRAGSIATLNRLCRAAGTHLEVVDPIVVEGQVVSSSRIRQCLTEGQVEIAARLLGRPHRSRGRVVPGAGRGAGLGFPTANLDDCDTLVPSDGVYACRAACDGEVWPAAVHVGANVTFGATRRSIEAHLIGFSGDLSAQLLALDWLARLRGSRKFDSAGELVRQMQEDVAQSLAIVSQADGGPGQS